MQVAVYCNGVDVLLNEPCILEAGGGIRQREAVLRSFALIDTSKPVRSFSELFSSRLSEASGALMTCIVSPNAYDDFASLILQYHTRHPDMKWFLPYSGTVPPEMEEELRSLITFISLAGRKVSECERIINGFIQSIMFLSLCYGIGEPSCSIIPTKASFHGFVDVRGISLVFSVLCEKTQ